MSLVPSLSALGQHSIFIPPSLSKTRPEPDWELLDAPADDDDVPLKTSRMVVRDKDLIVAHGSEIRVAYTGGQDWEVHDGQLGRYKVSPALRGIQPCTHAGLSMQSSRQVLRSPELGFEVQTLALNSTGRLLAVVGKNRAVVVVLPKGGLTANTSGDLHCK